MFGWRSRVSERTCEGEGAGEGEGEGEEPCRRVGECTCEGEGGGGGESEGEVPCCRVGERTSRRQPSSASSPAPPATLTATFVPSGRLGTDVPSAWPSGAPSHAARYAVPKPPLPMRLSRTNVSSGIRHALAAPSAAEGDADWFSGGFG